MGLSAVTSWVSSGAGLAIWYVKPASCDYYVLDSKKYVYVLYYYKLFSQLSRGKKKNRPAEAYPIPSNATPGDEDALPVLHFYI